MIDDEDMSPFAKTGHNGGPLVDDDLIGGGWIPSYRGARDHPLIGFGKPVRPLDPKRGAYSRYEAHEDLKMEAAWKPHIKNINGVVVELDYGQLAHGLAFLSERWNWSMQRVRTYLKDLEQWGLINRKKIEASQQAPNKLPAKKQQAGQQTNNKPNNKLDRASKKSAPSVITIENYRENYGLQDAITEYTNGFKQQAEKQAANKLDIKKQQATVKKLTTTITSNNKTSNKSKDEESGLGVAGDHAQPEASPPADKPKPKPKGRLKKQRPLFDEDTGQPANVSRDQANAAIDFYNDLAKQHGWTVCRTRVNRIPRMELRLKEIEGLENFKDAVSAIPNSDFLSGRLPGKDGRAAFKMDIEALMSTRSNLGDVLAKLLDLAGSAEDKPKTMKDVNAHVASLTADEQRALVRKHANGIYPPSELGSLPSSDDCPMHDEVIVEFRLKEIYDDRGIKR